MAGNPTRTLCPRRTLPELLHSLCRQHFTWTTRDVMVYQFCGIMVRKSALKSSWPRHLQQYVVSFTVKQSRRKSELQWPSVHVSHHPQNFGSRVKVTAAARVEGEPSDKARESVDAAAVFVMSANEKRGDGQTICTHCPTTTNTHLQHLYNNYLIL